MFRDPPDPTGFHYSSTFLDASEAWTSRVGDEENLVQVASPSVFVAEDFEMPSCRKREAASALDGLDWIKRSKLCQDVQASPSAQDHLRVTSQLSILKSDQSNLLTAGNFHTFFGCHVPTLPSLISSSETSSNGSKRASSMTSGACPRSRCRSLEFI
ncbi:uncharacterized protein LOC129312159 [Prosopis cineraria]|uniref:uncharacterized protein LOC129312159 n=1 Tax=Prosopis cineraria TaxID=364024 RepID=UPI00240FE1AE|nr:uncharacterized protein LOC129312159 [Prosopis cineraria]